jgi:uncharacterized protein YcbK (DUF882 family)
MLDLPAVNFNELVETTMERRGFLKAGLTLSATAFLSAGLVKPALAWGEGSAYRVSFRNQHTGEHYAGVYRVGNKYLPEAFERINYVLRDFRQNEIFPIDPRAIDIVAIVHGATGSQNPYTLLSGYRSPKTNKVLRSNGEGVAKNSLHLSGQAIDVRLEGVNPSKLKDYASRLHAGGVGFYPRSGFVHMDSGAVRHWG